MVNTILGSNAEKTVKYRGGILQVDNGANTTQLAFAKEFEAQFNDEFVDEDLLDDGTPIFSPKSDRIGNFRILLKNTIDLLSGTVPAPSGDTLSYWITQVAAGAFPTLSFIRVVKAPDSAGNKFGRLKIDCRIMDVKVSALDDVGIEEDEIIGDIIAFTSFKREAS